MKSSVNKNWGFKTATGIFGLCLTVTFLMVGCGQNSHTTAPTPVPELNAGYGGDDVTNGNYDINFSLQADAGDPNYQPESVTLTFDSPDGSIMYFSGQFRAGMNLLIDDPLSIDPRSTQSWSKIKAAIKQGEIKNGSKFVFDKKLWAQDQGSFSMYYRMFTGQNGTFVPEAQRASPRALRMTAFVINQYGLSNSTSVIMPVRYRYAFDDEALGQGVDAVDGSRSYPADPAVNRVIPGLEWVSNPSLLNTNPACMAAFGLTYPYDYVDMTGTHGHNFAVNVSSMRLSSGQWTPVSVQKTTVLQAMGTALGGSLATFEPTAAYEGLCNRKVWGIVLIDRFIDLDVNGLRFTVSENGQSMDVIYGLTKMEAF